MTTSGPFTIRELGGEKRVIILVGRALPYRPFTLRTEQRVELTWLPGAPEATSTILGAKEGGPTTVTGTWKTKYLDVSLSGTQPPFTLDNVSVLSAFEAVDALESFVRLGQLVELTWLTQKRVGHLTGFDANWENHEDVAWSMDFVWVSRGEIPGAAVFIGDQTSTDTVSVMRSRFNAIDDIELPIVGLSLEFLEPFRESISELDGLVVDMEDTSGNFADKVISPMELTRGLIATLSTIEIATQTLLTTFDESVDAALNGCTPIGDQSYSEKLSASQYKAENRAWARELRREATQNKDQLTLRIDGELAGTHKARDGQDLRDISKIFYDTPFEWRRLMLFNNLNSIELIAGQTVLVPKFSPDSSGQLVGGA